MIIPRFKQASQRAHRRAAWFTAAAILFPATAQAQAIVGSLRIQQATAASDGTANAGAVVSVAPEFPKRVIDALDLVDQGKYGDAADIANALCAAAPNSPVARQLRGLIELWLGDTHRAEKDFTEANRQEGDEAVTHLALALCAMRAKDAGQRQADILGELDRSSTCAGLTEEQKSDIATIGAYYRYVIGEASAVQDLPNNGDPLRAELIALYTSKVDPKAGATALSKFLTTSTGIPHVREDEGLRFLFTEKPVIVEPTITDPSMQSMYIARVDQPRAVDPDDRTANPVWGTVTLAPEQSNPATTSVLYTIDGAPIATVTAQPYAFAWNTRLILNGVHTVRLEAHMDGGGIVDREVRQVRVANGPDTLEAADRATMEPATYMQIQARLWSLLKPRPSRAVAEMKLAGLREQAGDAADAQTHKLIATALDPWLMGIYHITARHTELPSRHYSEKEGVWSGYTGRKWVCLTFDDGPNPKTKALLDALDKAHARATFFIVGSRAEHLPNDVRRMAASGHDVENHSYTHPNIAQCTPAIVESEIVRTNIIIRSLTGRYPKFFRPPGGNASRTLAALSDAYGLKLAFWSLDVLKAEDESSKSNLINFVMKRVHPGSIILMHNGPDVTTAAIPDLVADLRAKGYQIVTLREIVKR